MGCIRRRIQLSESNCTPIALVGTAENSEIKEEEEEEEEACVRPHSDSPATSLPEPISIAMATAYANKASSYDGRISNVVSVRQSDSAASPARETDIRPPDGVKVKEMNIPPQPPIYARLRVVRIKDELHVRLLGDTPSRDDDGPGGDDEHYSTCSDSDSSASLASFADRVELLADFLASTGDSTQSTHATTYSRRRRTIPTSSESASSSASSSPSVASSTSSRSGSRRRHDLDSAGQSSDSDTPLIPWRPYGSDKSSCLTVGGPYLPGGGPYLPGGAPYPSVGRNPFDIHMIVKRNLRDRVKKRLERKLPGSSRSSRSSGSSSPSPPPRVTTPPPPPPPRPRRPKLFSEEETSESGLSSVSSSDDMHSYGDDDDGNLGNEAVVETPPVCSSTADFREFAATPCCSLRSGYSCSNADSWSISSRSSSDLDGDSDNTDSDTLAFLK